ncbi:MAG: ABC transporter permease [Gammaproteobacteria bacterium]|nr:ABC transporter permease [Gammaproteobacteria bacterium]
MLLFKLALRNVLRQRRRSALTCLTIAGGYVLCALSFSLVDGSYNNVIEIFTEDETGHVQIHKDDYLHKPKIHLTIDDPETVEETLANTAMITSFAPRIYAPALTYADEEHSPARVIGIDPAAEARTSRLRHKLTSGEWLDTAKRNDDLTGALIGASIATSLDIGIGAEIILISQGAEVVRSPTICIRSPALSATGAHPSARMSTCRYQPPRHF